LQRVKRLFNAAKAGHTGSLDPLATGMLPICFGEATKFSQHLLDANKVYEVTAQLGVRTDSGDKEGQVIHSQESQVTYAQLSQVLPQFRGLIRQVPPMHSAIKHEGKRLYEYARSGITIDRPAREVTIYQLDLINVDGQAQGQPLQTIALRVHCSKGTYIRSLIDDLGEALGCGAHVSTLHRTIVEPFQSYPMTTFEELEASADRDHYLLPMDAALAGWPRQTLSDEVAKQLLLGRLVILAPSLGQVATRFYSEADQFLGVGTVSQDGQVTNKRLISTNFSNLFSS